MPSPPPNILLITSDQQHYDTLGCANPRIRTPALDRLAGEGTRFDRAYCPNPTCTPTRASIITGMYPSQHGAWSLGTKLFEDVPTVGAQLGRAGYATGLIGKAHFQPLRSLPGMESVECQPTMRDLDFWRGFHGPWYGFEWLETARNHVCESHAGQHYAIWMEERGLKNWRDYFDDWPHNDEKIRRRHAQRCWDLPERFHYNYWTSEKTIAHLERSIGQGRPFFTWASFMDPHPPVMVPEPWFSTYRSEDMIPGRVRPGEHDRNPRHFRLTQESRPDFSGYREDQGIHGFHSHLRDPEELKKDIATYYAMVTFMDQEIGRILQALDRLGVAEHTLVVFTSDHGHFLGEHGLVAKGPFHYEEMIRVPLLVRWPGRVPAGAVSRNLQSLVDLAPTFLAAAGLDVPGVMTGVNELPTWRGGQAAREHVIVENRHTRSTVHLRTYVDERYKLTVYRQSDEGELFDLAQDPQEAYNLWDEPRAAGLKSRLLHRFMQATLAAEPTRMPRIWGA